MLVSPPDFLTTGRTCQLLQVFKFYWGIACLYSYLHTILFIYLLTNTSETTSDHMSILRQSELESEEKNIFLICSIQEHCQHANDINKHVTFHKVLFQMARRRIFHLLSDANCTQKLQELSVICISFTFIHLEQQTFLSKVTCK